ncbi:MAG: 4Fe-4S dicluster domain-containing protein [Candidatus Dasytiphilus stammeri]
MTLMITEYCVNCDMCVAECPNNAIIFKKEKRSYSINQENCTECRGYYITPNCQKVCPINKAIIKIIS